MKAKVIFLVSVLISVFPEIFLANPNVALNKISGRVVDSSTGAPLEYVSVAVYKSSDSALVTGMVSDTAGNFNISNIDNGDYYLAFSYVGFEKKETEKVSLGGKNRKAELGNIELAPASTGIGEVVVSAEKQRVEYKIDKRVINVDKDINAKGGTAVDVLENTPSIQVDAQKNVTLRGSSDFIVLIDGKPSVVKGSEALKQLPASAIKQIEVITNPSAKYDSEGQAGIINIVTKKERLQGLNGSMNLAAGTKDKRTGNVLANYRQGKFNFFTGVDYADNKYMNDMKINNKTMLTSDHEFINQTTNQFSYQENLTFKGGVDYDINEKNSMSISGSYGNQGYDNGSDSRYHIWNLSDSKNNYNVSNYYKDVIGEVIGLNGDYTHKFNENHSLSFNNSYSSWEGMDRDQLNVSLANNVFDNTGVDSKLKYDKDNYNFQYRANIDYKRPLFKGNFETGVQFRYEDRNEDFVFQNFDLTTQEFILNNTYSYKLDYLNSIYSGYMTYAGNAFGIGYQLGVRSEYFTRKIDISNIQGRIDFDNFMIYPTVHLSKDFNGKHQMQLSYSRRMNYPQPWLLNNTPSYIDPRNIFQGSPYLKPEYTDAYEMNYRTTVGKFTFSTQTYFRNTWNSFQALRLLDENGIMRHQLTNSSNQKAYGVEQGVDINLLKWWTINTSANIYHYTLKTMVQSSEKVQKVNTWDARFINSFNFKTGTRIQAVSYFRAPSLDAQGEVKGFYTVNLGINQSLMKNKANVGVSVQNMFNSIKFDYSVQNSNFDNTYHIMVEGPVVMLNFSYTFNNFQHKNRGRADDTSFKGGGAF